MQLAKANVGLTLDVNLEYSVQLLEFGRCTSSLSCCMQYLKKLGWGVQTGLKLRDLHQVVAPDVDGDADFEIGDGNSVYVEALSV